MRLRTFGFGLVLALISSAAYAQTQTYQLINGIKVEAVAVSSASRTSTGTVLQGIQFRAQSGTTPPKFYQRAVDFSKGTTATSIKSFAKGNAFQLGLTAAILGVGWAMDELTGQIYSVPLVPGHTLTCTTQCFRMDRVVGANTTYAYGDSLADVSAQVIGTNVSPGSVNIITGIAQYNSATVTMFYRDLSGSPTFTRAASIVNRTSAPANYVTWPTGGTQATDNQIADQLTPQLSPDALKKLHTDPVTGAIQKPQEVLNKMTDVANQYARELDPNSVNATAPTAQPIPATSELPATDSLPQTAALDLPDFCTWATTVCEYMDWTKEMPTEPVDSEFTVASLVDETEVNLESYSSGLGSGSCPSPESLVLLGNTYNFSWQPACSLASGMSLLLIAGAYLSSIFILLGIRR